MRCFIEIIAKTYLLFSPIGIPYIVCILFCVGYSCYRSVSHILPAILDPSWSCVRHDHPHHLRSRVSPLAQYVIYPTLIPRSTAVQ